ncbi:magnesium transporter NIPA-domain-containing protein [Blastocladiella britannica]|nr:magnesium transporter NIPA-domain-containing protein [Blastocladiella britannica]
MAWFELDDERASLPSLIGISIAIAGNLLISAALNLQKYAHRPRRPLTPEDVVPIVVDVPDPEAALLHHADNRDSAIVDDCPATTAGPSRSSSSPPSVSNTDFTRDPVWWTGVVLMLLGETGNFLAYGFSPASVIAPLGTVALISNAIIAPVFLGETFRARDFAGVLLAIIGTVVIVSCSRSADPVLDAPALAEAFFTLRFLIYLSVTAAALVFLRSVYAVWHKRTVLVDLGFVAIFGGWTVVSTKAISTLIGGSLFAVVTFPIFYPLAVVMIGTGVLQIRYLNTALAHFDATVVIPTQFVLFTISAIAGSSTIYGDFDQQSPGSVIGFLTGCLLTFLAVYLIGSQRPGSQVVPLDPRVVSSSICEPRLAPVRDSAQGTWLSESEALLPNEDSYAEDDYDDGQDAGHQQRPRMLSHGSSSWRGSPPPLPPPLHRDPSSSGPDRLSTSERSHKSYLMPPRSPRSMLAAASAHSPRLGGVSASARLLATSPYSLDSGAIGSPPSAALSRATTPRGSNPYLPTAASRVSLAAYSAGMYSTWAAPSSGGSSAGGYTSPVVAAAQQARARQLSTTAALVDPSAAATTTTVGGGGIPVGSSMLGLWSPGRRQSHARPEGEQQQLHHPYTQQHHQHALP